MISHDDATTLMRILLEDGWDVKFMKACDDGLDSQIARWQGKHSPVLDLPEDFRPQFFDAEGDPALLRICFWNGRRLALGENKGSWPAEQQITQGERQC